MSRYKIVIQYDGTNFSGFQSQKNQSGIQDNIESSISKLNNDKKIKIYGASRTDAGVHALGQVAHFDLDSKFSEKELLKACLLYTSPSPRDISGSRMPSSA